MYFKEDTEKSIFSSKKNSKTICSLKISCTFAAVIKKRDVAQLASAPRSGRGGRKFESSHPDYKNEDISNDISSFFIHTNKICTFILSFL